MFAAVIACLLLVAANTLIHYESLRLLTATLPVMRMHKRAKLLVVIFSAFVAHAVEIGVYGVAIYILIEYLGGTR